MAHELDALVHRHVFGLIWSEERCRVCGWPLMEDDGVSCTADACSRHPTPACRADEPPPYSTDVASAWRVVEYLRDEGYWVTMANRPLDHHTRDVYHVGFRRSDNLLQYRQVSATAETLTEAICLAALKVVDQEGHGDVDRLKR